MNFFCGVPEWCKKLSKWDLEVKFSNTTGAPSTKPPAVMTAVDGWQRRIRWVGVPYAVMKKFGDDNANLLVVALAWYGFSLSSRCCWSW